ncbi:TIGR02647 family protein [Salinibius halmophilus]|uniref:TIGR02647 family protein n=1 Tax=Salinibius halmophilus TaxID=1853216 RepID=UPI000E67561B|nr:TIGR02647 family protein [Salinibius halmophilus]
MSFNQHAIDEMNVLLQFPTDSRMSGIKIHSDAPPATRDAAERLFKRGYIDAIDGGYLTDAGLEFAEHVQKLHFALTTDL